MILYYSIKALIAKRKLYKKSVQNFGNL